MGVIEKQPKHPDVQPKQALVDPKAQAHKSLEQTLEDPDDKPRESLEETPQAPVAQSHEGPEQASQVVEAQAHEGIVKVLKGPAEGLELATTRGRKRQVKNMGEETLHIF